MTRRILSPVALTAAWLVAMLICFRAILLSGFDLGFGDRADGIIEISLLEHWRNVLGGAAVWNTPSYFHPYAGTLGYNDGYFLYGLVYSFWRMWFDPFVSDTLNAATFKTIGFFASYALVSRSLGWGRPVALLVAVLFTVSNGMAVHAVHAQIQSIALLPVLMMLGIAGVRAEASGRRLRARLLAVAGAALIGAWLITAYYMIWFTLFFGAALVLCWLWTSGNARPGAVWGLVRAHGGTIAIAGAAFVIACAPFLWVYLPKAGETGAHGYWKMLGYLVTPIDLINVGTGNYLWGWIPGLFRAVFAAFGSERGAEKALGGEHESGFPLILFVLSVTAAWKLLVRPGTQDPFLRAYALAVVITWALTLQLWVLSPWGAVFELVPGAKGLRVVLRYQLFLVLPVLLLVFAAYRVKAERLIAMRPWAAAGLAALLVAEQLTGQSAAQLSRTAHLRVLEAVPAPPRECRSFYVVTARRAPERYRSAESQAKFPHNVDAMLLSQLWRVPTVSGYSTFQPPDWRFTEPLAADYDTRVRAYASAHRLSGLCRLDMRSSQPWTKPL